MHMKRSVSVRKWVTAFSASLEGAIVSLNRLSVGCGTTPRRQSGHICGFCFVYPRDLYNAATLRTLP